MVAEEFASMRVKPCSPRNCGVRPALPLAKVVRARTPAHLSDYRTVIALALHTCISKNRHYVIPWKLEIS